MSNTDYPTDTDVREKALAKTRDALAALRQIPVAGLDQQKAGDVLDAIDDVAALEKQLANEVDQLRAEDEYSDEDFQP